jgi:hypothetical protein
MITRTKTLAASLALGAAVLFTPMAPAAAQTTTIGDQLVNVAIGDVTILEDVNVAVAANLVAQICGTNVDVIAVDLGTVQQATCKAGGGKGQTVKVTQN